ncbi:L,D-transpeptidase [Streptomyces sp. NPDC005322]|uniref:L,D-transpeptidase n=1 Tax=unclassified Streptomyces TaxID=2593676 RepID=UPI0033A49E75
MARSSTGPAVALLTAAALAGVGFLGYQAAATAPDHPTQARPGSHSGGAKDKPKATKPKPKATALPARSGTGQRIVYSLGGKRVWLVSAQEKATRTFEVGPSPASPDPGTYQVTDRRLSGVGSDGVQVEHIVVFHSEGGAVFGFSAAVDGSMPDPKARKRTGAIRESRADATALFEVAPVGTKVVVLP